jgi:hypothetical protein
MLSRTVDDNVFTTDVPIEVYGGQVERLAETLEPKDMVLIEGHPGYRRPDANGAEKRPVMPAVVT